MNKLRNWLITMVIAIALGAGGAWWWARPAPAAAETAAPEQVQTDGSKVLARADQSPGAKPTMAVPAGAKVERIVKATVTPAADYGVRLPVDGKCPPPEPVTVDLALVRMPDGGRRVVASSPDGEVSGIDVPVEPMEAVAEERPWAAGVSVNPGHQTAGVWVERDVGRVRLGAEINQTRLAIGGPLGTEARVRVGWVF